LSRIAQADTLLELSGEEHPIFAATTSS
jgi:hypothetical protein